MKEYIRRKIAVFCMDHILCIPLFLFAKNCIFNSQELKAIEMASLRYIAIHRNDDTEMNQLFYRFFVFKEKTPEEKLQEKLNHDLK